MLFQCFHVLILRRLCASSKVVRVLPCMGRLHEENVFVSFVFKFFLDFSGEVCFGNPSLILSQLFSCYRQVKVVDYKFNVKLQIIPSRLE